MRGVLCKTEKILQISTFGPWNHVELIYPTSSLFLVTSPIPTCALSAAVVDALEHTTTYPRLFFKYTVSIISILFEIMKS